MHTFGAPVVADETNVHGPAASQVLWSAVAVAHASTTVVVQVPETAAQAAASSATDTLAASAHVASSMATRPVRVTVSSTESPRVTSPVTIKSSAICTSPCIVVV